MTDKKIVVFFVEGNREIDFINEIVARRLKDMGKYNVVTTYKYKSRLKSDNEKAIRSFRTVNSDILCMADIDSSSSIESRKEKLKLEDIGEITNDYIIVVIKEIESWYLAGLDRQCCKKIRIEYKARTDTIGKEECHAMIAKSKFRPRQACMVEILKRYNLGIAKAKNKSFFYFYETVLS